MCLLLCNWQVLTGRSLSPIEWQAVAWSHCKFQVLTASLALHGSVLLRYVYQSFCTCTARSHVTAPSWDTGRSLLQSSPTFLLDRLTHTVAIIE